MACGTCVVSLPVFACLLPALLPCSLLKVFTSSPHSSLVDGLTTINFLALPKFTAPKLIDPHRYSSLPLFLISHSVFSFRFSTFPHRRCGFVARILQRDSPTTILAANSRWLSVVVVVAAADSAFLDFLTSPHCTLLTDGLTVHFFALPKPTA